MLQDEQDLIDEYGPHATLWTLGCQNKALVSAMAIPWAVCAHLVQLGSVIFASLSCSMEEQEKRRWGTSGLRASIQWSP